MYRYDLHVHTKEVSPCGKLTVEETVDLYKAKGYDGFWLTNHFHREFFERTKGLTWEQRVEAFFLPWREGKKYAGEDFFIGQGMELRFLTDPNDYLLFGITEELLLAEGEEWLSMNLERFFEKYHERLLIIQAHPNRQGSSRPVDPRFLHGMEAHNSNPRHDNGNGATCSLICAHPRLIPTAGSDSHRREDAGITGILTGEKLTCDEELIGVLEDRRYEILMSSADAL